MAVQFKDYYQILGVPKTATAKEIKSAFRKKSKQTHPDLHPGKAEQFKDLNEAYEVLGDEQKRQRYDQLGAHYRHGDSVNPGQYGGGYGGGGAINLEDILGAGFGGGFGGAGGFSDFFEMFMGGNMGGNMGGAAQQAQARRSPGGAQQAARPPQELNVEADLPLTLEEAAFGVQKQVRSPQTGQPLAVTIPAGVRAGAKIRLSGHGHRNNRGQTGDLHLMISLKPHSTFKPEPPNHLLYELALSLPQLVLGATASVPALTKPGQPAKTLQLTVPPLSAPGQKLRLKGHGWPATGKEAAGDLHVQLKAHLPKTLSPEQKALYQKLLALESG